MAKPPSGAYREAMLAARAAQGRVSVETGKEIEKLLRSLATELDTKVADAARLGTSGRFVAQQVESRRIIGGLLRDFNVRLERAIADGRALAFEEVSEVWELATRKIAASTVQGAATGAVRIPSVNLYGTYNAVGAASNWRTLVSHSVSKFAIEADAIVGESLANGLGGAELSRRMRSLVEGSEPFRDLFEKVPDKLTGKLVSKVDLRKVPKEVRGSMAQMRYNADRIAFSEIANARREAEVQAGLRDTSIKMYQWNTSPDRGDQDPDECDVLEASDYYGLGPGMYPVDKVPPIPHPFDRCEIEPIPFGKGEVSGGAQRPLPDRKGGGLIGRFPPGMSAKAEARATANIDRLFGEVDNVDLRAIVEKLPTVPVGTPPPPVPTPGPTRKLSVEDLGEDWIVRVYGGDGKAIQKRYISPNGKMYSSLKQVRKAIDDGLETLGSGSAKFEDAVSKKKSPIGGKKKPKPGDVDEVAAAEAGAADAAKFEDPYGFGVKYETRGSIKVEPGVPDKPVVPVRDVKRQISSGGDYVSPDSWRAAGYEYEEVLLYREKVAYGAKEHTIEEWVRLTYTKAEILNTNDFRSIVRIRIKKGTTDYARNMTGGESRVSRQAYEKVLREVDNWRSVYGLSDEAAVYEAVPAPPKFKSTDAAEDWLEKMYEGKAFDLKGMDVEIAQAVAEEWVALAREFPTVARELRLIGSLSRKAKWEQVGLRKSTRLGPNTYGVASSYDRFLGINKKYYSDPVKMLTSKYKDTVRDRWGHWKGGKKGTQAVTAAKGRRLRSWNTSRGIALEYDELAKTNVALRKYEAALKAEGEAVSAKYATSWGTPAREVAEAASNAATAARKAAKKALGKDPEYRALAARMGRTTFRHEFGHHIDFAYTDPSSNYSTVSAARSWIPAKDLPPVLDKFSDPRKFGADWTRRVAARVDEYADEVSYYGTKDRYEYWAEASNASRYSDDVGKGSHFVKEWRKITDLFVDPRRDAVLDSVSDWGTLSSDQRRRIAERVQELARETGSLTAPDAAAFRDLLATL